MDIPQIATTLGLPAAISGILIALVKALFDLRQRKSKESLLDWLAQPLATEPFKDDDRALRALHELRQSLVFERAFGIKAESRVRNELLVFAESQHESVRFREALDIGRIVSRFSFPQLSSPKQLKIIKAWSLMAKLAGYSGFVLGYILFFGYLYSVWTGGVDLREAAQGIALGGIMTLGGIYNVRSARRFEIVAAFLRWHSENQRSSGKEKGSD
jgi:hypothetical protein